MNLIRNLMNVVMKTISLILNLMNVQVSFWLPESGEGVLDFHENLMHETVRSMPSFAQF